MTERCSCGERATCMPYGVLPLCRSCKHVAASYCWSKLQGIEESHIQPRYEDGKAGKTYLCILCGYWHWTSHTEELSSDLVSAVWALSRLMARTGFHINMARGWDKIRHLPAEADHG